MSDEEEKARELGSFVRRQSQQSLRNIDQDEIQENHGQFEDDAYLRLAKVGSAQAKDSDTSNQGHREPQAAYPIRLPSNDSFVSAASGNGANEDEKVGGKKIQTEHWLRSQLQPHLSNQKPLQDIEDFYRFRTSSNKSSRSLLRAQKSSSRAFAGSEQNSQRLGAIGGSRGQLRNDNAEPQSQQEESSEKDIGNRRQVADSQDAVKSDGSDTATMTTPDPVDESSFITASNDIQSAFVKRIPLAKRSNSEPVRTKEQIQQVFAINPDSPTASKDPARHSVLEREHIPDFKDARMPSDAWELGSDKSIEMSEGASTTTKEANASMELRKSQSDAMAELKKFSFRLDTKLASLENKTKHWNRARNQLKSQVHKQNKAARQALKDLKAQLAATQEFLDSEEQETRRLWEIVAEVQQKNNAAQSRMEDIQERISDQAMLADAQRNAFDRLHSAMQEIIASRTPSRWVGKIIDVRDLVQQYCMAWLEQVWYMLSGSVWGNTPPTSISSHGEAIPETSGGG